MKKLIYKSCFIFLYVINGYAQQEKVNANNQVEVVYEYSHSLSEQIAFDVLLYCTASKSQYIYDSKRKKINLSNGLRYTAPYHNYVTNYDFTSKTIEENRALKDGTVLYARWDNDLVWEISDEEKTIGNYTVRKATTNSIELNKKHPNYPGKVTAWFCPEIPIPAGPARYYGLPGLILELKYQKDGSTYKLKSIEGADDYKFKNITTENQVEKEDVIYFEHKNSTKVKETQKLKKRS